MPRYRIVYENTSIEAPEGTFLIGRSTECHLVLVDPAISRVHAAIILENDVLYVEDRKSRNGVRVNDQGIDGRKILNDGDKIGIGHKIISIHSVQQALEADRTLGLKRCEGCEAWMPAGMTTCAACGARLAPDSSLGPRQTQECIDPDPVARRRRTNSQGEQQPISLLASLAAKAIRVDKLDEAERLVDSVVMTAMSRFQKSDGLSNTEFNAVINVVLALAEALKSPDQVSRLFLLHLSGRRLMSRDLVEKMYDLVRLAAYRMCPEMSRYLSFLDSHAERYNAGERFVHRRVQGLVKLCS